MRLHVDSVLIVTYLARPILTSLSLLSSVTATLCDDLAEAGSAPYSDSWVMDVMITPRMQSLCTLHAHCSHLSTLLLWWCHVKYEHLAKRCAIPNLTECVCPSPRYVSPSPTMQTHFRRTQAFRLSSPSSVLLVYLFHLNCMVPYFSLKHVHTDSGERGCSEGRRS